MICNRCGNHMEIVGQWGDGYTEPYEIQYSCECGQGLNELQGYGLTWEIPEEEDKEEIIDAILDRSFRWSEDDLNEFDISALENIRAEVTSASYSE